MRSTIRLYLKHCYFFAALFVVVFLGILLLPFILSKSIQYKQKPSLLEQTRLNCLFILDTSLEKHLEYTLPPTLAPKNQYIASSTTHLRAQFHPTPHLALVQSSTSAEKNTFLTKSLSLPFKKTTMSIGDHTLSPTPS